jgi:hypothetical protein
MFRELGQKSPFLAADLEARPAPLPMMDSGENTGSVLVIGAPLMMGASRRPIEQGWMPPQVRYHHRSGEFLLWAGACLGLLLVMTPVSTC